MMQKQITIWKLRAKMSTFNAILILSINLKQPNHTSLAQWIFAASLTVLTIWQMVILKTLDRIRKYICIRIWILVSQIYLVFILKLNKTENWWSLKVKYQRGLLLPRRLNQEIVPLTLGLLKWDMST
jgi:molybdenum cofactor biosynthesis enzyme